MNPALSDAWYCVYLLGSKKAHCLYIGCTDNLEKRIEDHSNGRIFSTSKMLAVKLLYYEACNSKDLAYKREEKLKSYGSALAKLKLRIGYIKEGRAG